MQPGGDDLLEREREVGFLDRLVDDAAGGHGRVVLIEGPAGIGKSRLLAHARDLGDRRMTVLAARCSELERDFSFGAVRQLFEHVALDPARRDALLAGAAAPAAGVLEAPDGAEGSFAVLHGLYWATLNLAETRPVLLAIDDLQWADPPSLRFVAYLARRLEGAPVLVAASLRTTDPGTDPALIADIAADPLTETIRPGPLGAGAVAELIRARLGDDPEQPFSAACLEATGGNPLLLRQLLSALAADGVRPTGAGAAAVTEIGPGAVSRTVLLRLSRLPDESIAVARAVAVLGDSSGLPEVAALTALDEPRVARAVGELARAEILRPRPPLGFVHPLLRDAIYFDLPAGERELEHARAATVLADAHAPEEEIAAQLVHAPRRGDGATIELLRAAAGRAARRGGPESTVAYLARALAEPPAPDQRGIVLFDLGMAEAEMNAPAAAEHLRSAYGLLTDPLQRAQAAFALCQALLFTGSADEAAELARSAAAEVPSTLVDERQAIEGMAVLAPFFGARDHTVLDRIDEFRAKNEGDGPGAKFLRAMIAFAWTACGGPKEICEELALDALSGGESFGPGAGMLWSGGLLTLVLTGSGRTPELIEAGRAEAYRRGSVLTTASVEMFTGFYLLSVGDLESAEDAVRDARVLQERWGSDEVSGAWSRALLGTYRFLRGDGAGARAALGPRPADEDWSDGANLWRALHAEMLLADGEAERALAVADAMGVAAPHVVHPDWKPWQSLRGRALAALGRREEAVAALEAELQLASECRATIAIGRCERQLGEVEGEGSLERLERAIEILAGTAARLEHARAVASYGGAVRRARRPADAREPLRQALEMAEACGCPPLVEQIRSELHAAGARPRTAALGGVEALTARELRVATLAADGRTNRDIAQALYVTPKTVEVHLSNAYRKLDIKSRRELPTVLS